MLRQFIIILISINIFNGCYREVNPIQPPQDILVMSLENRLLPEDYYAHSDAISLYNGEVARSGYFHLELNLKSWTEEYGIELFVIEDLEFAKYQEGLGFNVKFRQTIKTRGLHKYDTSRYTGGHYRIVIDNTDRGWEDTDWDGSDDIATIDFIAYLK